MDYVTLGGLGDLVAQLKRKNDIEIAKLIIDSNKEWVGKALEEAAEL